MWPVGTTQFLKTRVSPDIKRQVQQAAGQQLVTESVWLRRLVMAGISSAVAANAGSEEGVSTSRTGETREARLYVRLRPEDRLLLRERALRDHTKALIKANLTSWEIGRGQTDL